MYRVLLCGATYTHLSHSPYLPAGPILFLDAFQVLAGLYPAFRSRHAGSKSTELSHSTFAHWNFHKREKAGARFALEKRGRKRETHNCAQLIESGKLDELARHGKAHTHQKLTKRSGLR